MLNISMKTMLESGVHFGHQTSRWNPKMSRFIFGERNGIHILDLQKTAKELKKAYTFLKEQAEQGAQFLFVGTKKQAQEIIKTEAQRADTPCVYEKWLGGTLTNFATVRKSVERLDELEMLETGGVFKKMSKKEVSRLTKEMNRYRKLLGGFRMMKTLPDVLFVIDPVDDHGSVHEAKKLGIPIVAVCDTNSDPDFIDYPIPGNDDAARSIKLFCAMAADAILEGRQAAKGGEIKEEALPQEEQEAQIAPETPAENTPAATEPKIAENSEI
ncbi:MAG: 30S ribosomal protein S2 [Elusimicrobia bacterium]|nr:30S ribosomal protein S2 [Elusimicrobiota bacterium]